jgi:Zn-finger nucleic acid-binding protein
MKGSTSKNHMRVELKYCEHCGALWIREGGAGVYCEKCLPTVADLPAPKRKPERRSTLPVRTRTTVDDLKCEAHDEEILDFEPAGGVA